ncbi:MAG: heavy metal translocating P-type ATPase [Candidatus Nanoperiomorbaceae bacterium]
MQKTTNFFKQYWTFAVTVIIGVVALIYAIATSNWSPKTIWNVPQILSSIWGIFIAIFLLINMIKTLRSGKYGVDILAITAIVSCILIGQFWAALVIVLMLTGGEALEDYASKRAQRELSALLKRAPQSVHIYDQNHNLHDAPIRQVKPGDLLLVKSSEVVPVDGELISDQAEFDESSLTGESLPVAKKPGDKIMSGSINSDNAITMRATATAENSQYEKIIALVRDSETNPAPFVRIADRYALPFTLISYAIAIIGWITSGSPLRFAEVLVVASPCPLILAAPIALIAGMSRSSRHGIIVKSGASLEKFAHAKAVAFDKTGTLTRGVVEIEEIVATGTINKQKLLQLAASAEAGSSHVLAESLLKAAKKDRVALLPATNLREITGSGIYATIDHQRVIIGQRDFLAKNKIKTLPANDTQTSIFISIGDEYVGRIIFADKLRNNAKHTISKLRTMRLRELTMLTGDNQRTAAAIAQKAGLDFRAELLPQGKVAAIKDLQKKYGVVAMVGDGINDAPVLATSDVGIAMGARGSTAASESADAVILLDDISRVVTFREIAKRTMRVALQSVWVGIVLCIILEIIAAFGLIPTIIGAGLQELIDVLVIFNALRALKDERSTSLGA